MKGATIQARNILLSVVLVWMCMCVHAGRYVCMQAREREVDSTFYCHILSNSYVRSASFLCLLCLPLSAAYLWTDLHEIFSV